ncbi:hypothetical protein B0I35DRAFT_480933 [Stachybotrys elegans]|uniref:SMP-30/Gluconolactonase/LRE-like region domain-containing protein n=1 Tax=Stachybotrys elegans TaxID=80388 RepID=A0A8K0WNG8_9HYPO|nr:hypothetical protein B0I35DRAFT_480933 [Stachybotrys elegans]
MTSDHYVDEVVLVEELPSNSWVEGMVLRPNGEALLTRLDQPELHVVDPSVPDALPRLVHTFPDCSGVLNLCPLTSDKEEYAVITAMVDVEKVQFHTFTLWRLGITSDDAQSVEVSKIAALPDALLALGVIPVSDRILLLADSGKNCIWRVNITTGNMTLLVESDWMKAISDEDFFGLNRLRLVGHYLWFTNNSAGSLCRIPIELSEDPDVAVEIAGDVQLVSADIPHCDGLVISGDSKAAYMVNYVSGTLWRVDIDPSGRGSTVSIMENLVCPTAVELREADGKRKLYVVCCGEIEVGWVTEDDRRSWGDIAQINASVEVSVTVTEEVA